MGKQGPEWVLAKKSEKCVMPSQPGGGMHADCLRDLKDMVSYRGSGGPPPENFWIRGPQLVNSNAFWGHLSQYQCPHPTVT